MLAAVQLFKELPDAVGYSTYGPIKFPLPEEFSSALPENISESLNHVVLFGISIYNQASKEQENIRVLFDGELSFAPKLRFDRRKIDPKYEISVENKEIIISSLPPNETLSIDFFNPRPGFRIHQVLVGNREVTKLMQKLAEAKRYPDLARLQLLTIFLVVGFASGATFVGNKVWKRVQEDKVIGEATKDLSSCSPYVFENTPENERLLERRISQLGIHKYFVLYANKVDTLEKLKQKDKVILCDPLQP